MLRLKEMTLSEGLPEYWRRVVCRQIYTLAVCRKLRPSRGLLSRSIEHAVRHRPLIAEVRVRSETSACRICGLSGTGTKSFTENFGQYHSSGVSYSTSHASTTDANWHRPWNILCKHLQLSAPWKGACVLVLPEQTNNQIRGVFAEVACYIISGSGWEVSMLYSSKAIFPVPVVNNGPIPVASLMRSM